MKEGPVAERLGRALQKLLQRFESARDLEKFDLCQNLKLVPFDRLAQTTFQMVFFISRYSFSISYILI
jgi:hypothetical protein